MAYVKQNIFVEGVSGTIAGQMTLKVRKNKTVVCVKRGPDTMPPTGQQITARDKFEDALSYAREAIADPIKKLMYAAAAKGGQTAYNVAFQDAAKPPKIILVNTERYKGLVGDVITIAVRNVVRVESVKVKILSAAGEQIEQGDAVPGPRDAYWHYTATIGNATLIGARLLITVTDLPGNKADMEKLI
jgi:hypothetical protein